jgi:hypothetical protein
VDSTGLWHQLKGNLLDWDLHVNSKAEFGYKNISKAKMSSTLWNFAFGRFMVSNYQVKSAAITPTYNNKIGFDLVVNLQIHIVV